MATLVALPVHSFRTARAQAKGKPKAKGAKAGWLLVTAVGSAAAAGRSNSRSGESSSSRSGRSTRS